MPTSMFLSMIYSLVHFKMHSEVAWPEIQYGHHQTWQKSQTMLTLVLLSPGNWSGCVILCSWVWSIHLCTYNSTQKSPDLKSNMAIREFPEMLSFINFYSSQTFRGTNQKEAKCDGWGNQMCCKSLNKAVTWSMFWSVSYGVFFPQTIQAVQVDGPQLQWGLSSPSGNDRPLWSGFMQVVHVGQHSGVVSFYHVLIIYMNPNDDVIK